MSKHILHSITFLLRKLCLLRDNVEIYGTVRRATYDKIIGSMCFALWINNSADKHTEYVSVLFTHGERVSVLRL
jgi:hypothetical protein